MLDPHRLEVGKVADAAVAVWGEGVGYSDVAANWVGGQLPAGKDIDVPAGTMLTTDVSTANLTVRAGATVAVVAVAGLLLSFLLDNPVNNISGTLYVGTLDFGASMVVSGPVELRGNGTLRLLHPDSAVLDDPGRASYLDIGPAIDFGGMGSIQCDLLSQATVKGDDPASTLEIASPLAVIPAAVAQNGGSLRFSGGRVEALGDVFVQPKAGSSIVIGAGTTLKGPHMIQGAGALTFEGAPQLQNAAFSGDFTYANLTVTEKLDLRPLNSRPAGKITIEKPDALAVPAGLAVNSDYDNDGVLSWTPQPAPPASTLVRHISDQLEEVSGKISLADAWPRFFVRSNCTLIP